MRRATLVVITVASVAAVPDQWRKSTFAQLNINNEYTQNTAVTFFGDEDMGEMAQCIESGAGVLRAQSDLTLRMQRDDSSSSSTIRYYRLDNGVTKTFKFSGGYADHTSVTYDAATMTLRCTGGNAPAKNVQCKNLGIDTDVKGVVLSVDFKPRDGSAHGNQWNRNMYSINGSYFSLGCLTSMGEEWAPVEYMYQDNRNLALTLFAQSDLDLVRQCGGDRNLRVDTDVTTLSCRRNDSSSSSSITYYRFDEDAVETFTFSGGYADNTEVTYDASQMILRCTGGNAASNNVQCKKLGIDQDVKAIVLAVNFKPRSGSAHANQWNRNRWSLTGSYFKLFCRSEEEESDDQGMITGTLFPVVAVENEDRDNYAQTFFSDTNLAILRCPDEGKALQITSDVTFRIRRDDSSSSSKITYYRFDNDVVESFVFSGGYADHTTVTYNAETMTLRCTGGNAAKKNIQCKNLGIDVDVKAIVLSVDFKPRTGSAHGNQWNRNWYSISGSHFYAACTDTTILAEAGECGAATLLSLAQGTLQDCSRHCLRMPACDRFVSNGAVCSFFSAAESEVSGSDPAAICGRKVMVGHPSSGTMCASFDPANFAYLKDVVRYTDILCKHPDLDEDWSPLNSDFMCSETISCEEICCA